MWEYFWQPVEVKQLNKSVSQVFFTRAVFSFCFAVVVTFLRSRKGRSIVVNNYRYCIGDQSNYWTTWRCTRRRVHNQENCRAVVCLTRDYRVVLKNAHNHEAPGTEHNFPSALVVQQRTCHATTMNRLNSWRCNLQREKERQT